MLRKHAYLVMAHNEFDILQKQLILLDDHRNDFYIHIDKKVKDFDFDYYKRLVKKSKIIFIQRTDTRWGDYSLVHCELNLLKEAEKEKYDYYHLISGVDLPLKNNDEIHNFFEKNKNIEFVHFSKDENLNKIEERISFYYFMKYYRTHNRYMSFLFQKINLIFYKIQYLFKFKRNWDKEIELKYGSQWFSITNELVRYIISKEEWINKKFKYTYCSDELFLQTIVYNSRFKDKLYVKKMDDNYKASLRLIDWKRGNPYTYKKEDFQELINSDRLFARKFSSLVDKEIIFELFEFLIKFKK